MNEILNEIKNMNGSQCDETEANKNECYFELGARHRSERRESLNRKFECTTK